MILELIDFGDGGGFPGGVGTRVAHGGAGACKVQTGGVGSRADDRPCLGQNVRGDVVGVSESADRTGGSHIGVVRLYPQDALRRAGALVIGAVGKSRGAAGVCLIQRAVAGSVIGDCHIGGVAGDVEIRTGGAEDFAVVEGSVYALFLGVSGGAVEDVRPEIAGEARAVGGCFDVLCRVKAEAVYAAVDAFFQQSLYPLLNIAVAGVQIGHTQVILGDVVAAVVVEFDIIGVIIVAVLEVGLDSRVDIAVGAAVGAVVREMVGDNIDNDLDAVLIRLGTQRGQLRLGAEPRGVVRGDGKTQRLVHLPPFVAEGGVGSVVVLRPLYRRGLYGGVAGCRDIRQGCLDVVVRPVETVQDVAALDGVLCIGGVGSRRRSRDDADRSDRQYHTQRQQQAGELFAVFHV